MTTLHIRCGDDLEQSFRLALIPGDYCCFADPLAEGPVPSALETDAYLDVRGRYLAKTRGIAFEAAKARLQVQWTALGRATGYDEIFLWFEHDPHDQLILARLLAWIADQPGMAERTRLICVDYHPSLDRFTGLGALAPDWLRPLHEQARPLTEDDLTLGKAVWHALGEDTPFPLARLMQTGTPAIPVMADALRRHLQELPWTESGLGLTEALCLRAIQTGARRFNAIFRDMADLDWLPTITDEGVGITLRRLISYALVEEETEGKEPRYGLTHKGDAVIGGRSCLKSVAVPDRWVGGVPVTEDAPNWRWHPDIGVCLLP